VRELPSAEAAGDLDAVAGLQELDGAADLGVEVADADLRREADLLEFDRALVTTRVPFPASLLVMELPVFE
jgi:hypothetical protein